MTVPGHEPVFRTPGAWPLLWLGSLAAVYACVPETDRLRIVGGVLGGFVLVEIANRRPFPWTGQAVIAGVLLWESWYGAVGRSRAQIGGTFAVLFPVALVVAASWLPSRVRPPERGRWIIGAIGVGCAVVVARTGGLEPGAGPVLRSIAVWGAVGAVASGLVVGYFAARVAKVSGAG